MSFKLCTVEDIRGETKRTLDAEFDTLLGRIIAAVTTDFAHLAHRPDWDKKARTIFLSPPPFTKQIFLDSPPIASSPVIQVWQNRSNPRVYGADELLTLDEDYFVLEEEGFLVKESYATWLSGIKTIKVTYTGGYLSEDGKETPSDLKDCAVTEALRRFSMRDREGLQSESFQGASVSYTPSGEQYARLMRVIGNYRVHPTL